MADPVQPTRSSGYHISTAFVNHLIITLHCARHLKTVKIKKPKVLPLLMSFVRAHLLYFPWFLKWSQAKSAEASDRTAEENRSIVNLLKMQVLSRNIVVKKGLKKIEKFLAPYDAQHKLTVYFHLLPKCLGFTSGTSFLLLFLPKIL